MPKKDDTPKMPNTLYIFEPNTLPRAKSTFLRNTDNTPTTNSGSEVPKATRETPIIDSEITFTNTEIAVDFEHCLLF